MNCVALNVLQLHLLALQLRNVCRCLAKQSLQNCDCSRSIGGALVLVVGLVGLCGFGTKSELVALCSRVLTGSDPTTTKPCLVPLGTLFTLPALELHLGCMFASHEVRAFKTAADAVVCMLPPALCLHGLGACIWRKAAAARTNAELLQETQCALHCSTALGHLSTWAH